MAIVNKFILQGESKQLLEELGKAENAYNNNLLAVEEISIKINENKRLQIEADKKATESKKKLEKYLKEEIALRENLKSLSKGSAEYNLTKDYIDYKAEARQPIQADYDNNKNRVAELKNINKELSVEKERIALLNKEVKRESQTTKKAYHEKIQELKKWGEDVEKDFARFNKVMITKAKARSNEIAQLKKLKEANEEARFNEALREHFPLRQKEFAELIKYEEALENASKNRAKRSIEAQKRNEKEIAQLTEKLRQQERETQALKDSVLVYSKAEQVERKYNDLRNEAIRAYSKGIITKEELKTATKNLAKAQKVETQSVNDGTNALVRHIRRMESIIVGVYALKSAYDKTMGRGHEFNKLIETETVGLKLLIAQNLRNVDVHGNAVTALQKFEYAQTKANEAIKIAREINVQTPHTLGETLQIYKLLVPQVLKLGGSLEDVGKITKNVSVVGASMGIEFQQLLKTVDSLMSGEMQESGLKRAMEQFGITQKEVNKTIRDGGNVVELFIDKLKQVDPATIAISKTWQGATAQFINQWDELWAEVNKPIFDAFKSGLVTSAEALKNNKEEIKTTVEWVREAIGYVTTFGTAWATYTGYVWLANKATMAMGDTSLTTRQRVANLSKSLWALGKSNLPLMAVVGAFEAMHFWTRKEERALESLNKTAKLTTTSLLKLTRARFKDTTAKLKKGLQDSTVKLNELRTAMKRLNKGDKLEVFNTSSFGIDSGLDIIDRATMSLEEQKDAVAELISKEEEKKKLYTDQLLTISKISKATQKEAEHKRELADELQRQKRILSELNFKAMEHEVAPPNLKDKISKATSKVKELNIELGKISKRIKDEIDDNKILYKSSPISDTSIQALQKENEQLDKTKILKKQINKLDEQKIKIEKYLNGAKGKIGEDDRLKYEKALSVVVENQRLKKKELLELNRRSQKAHDNSVRKLISSQSKLAKYNQTILENKKILNGEVAKHSDKIKVALRSLQAQLKVEKDTLKIAKIKADISNKRVELKRALAKEAKEEDRAEKSRLREYKKRLQEQFDLESQNIKIDSLRYELKNGEANRIDILKRQLELLKRQSVEGLKQKEINKHKIDILNKELKIKREVLQKQKEEFDLKSQIIKIESLEYELQNAKVNKLDVLEKELSLLKSQSMEGLKQKEINSHTIDILNKELEIKKEIGNEWKSVEDKQKELFKQYKQQQQEKLKAEIEYQNLLGNYDFGEQLEYEKRALKFKKQGIDITAQQIKMLEKQKEAQDALNASLERGINTLLQGVLNGEDLGETLKKVFEDVNKSATESFSKSITDTLVDSLKKGEVQDFGIFDANGNLSSVGKNGAMALGSLFAKEAFGDSKNAQRGTEYGQMAGMAIGSAFGSPEIGSAIGSIVGGAIGYLMGGEKSYYTSVNTDGTVEAHQRTSGGLFSSSSDKVLDKETQQLQMAFDSTIESYQNLLSSLFDINKDIEILAGRYSSGSLINEIIPQEVIDMWTQPPITHQDISVLENRVKERDNLVRNLYNENSNGIVDEALADKIDLYNESIKLLSDKYNATVKDGVVYMRNQSTVTLSALDQQALDRSTEIKNAWQTYAELKDKTFNEVFVESLQGLQNTSVAVFEQIWQGDKIKVLEERTKRSADAIKNITSNATYAGVNLENYEMVKSFAIKDGATPEEIARWTQLGNLLVENSKNADALADAIKAEDDAKKAFTESVAVSTRSFEDWVGTFNKTDIESALYTRTQAEKDYQTALANTGLESATTANILSLLSSAKTEEEKKKYETLADAYRTNQEALMSYNDALTEQDEKLKALMDSFQNVELSWDDYNNTLGMDDTSKVNYQINQVSHDLGLVGVSFENFGSLLNGIKSDVEAGKITDEDLGKWSELNNLLQQQHDLQLQLEEEKKKALKELKDSIVNTSRDFDNFFTTFNMTDLEKNSFNIEEIEKNLGITGVTIENYTSLLATSTKEQLADYTALGNLLESRHALEQKIEEERIAGLKKERAEILKNRDTVRSSMESIINAQISSIKQDFDNRSSSIESLRNAMSGYAPTKTIYSHEIYNSISNSDYKDNGAIESDITAWHNQQLEQIKKRDELGRKAWEDEKNRLQEAENKRVKSANASIDATNKQIQLTNALADKITGLKESVSKSFKDMYTTTTVQFETSFYDALANKDYANLGSKFSSFASATKNSNLSDTEAFIKIARANQAVQNIVAPTKQNELEHIEAKTIQIADYTSIMATEEAKINEATVTMYKALIKQNEENLPDVQSEITKLFEQNKQYFEAGSDFYKFLERGATELTYTEKMDEQKTLWHDYQKEAREFNNKKIGTLEKIDLSFNKYALNNQNKVNGNTSSIADLQKELQELKKEQKETNKLNKELLAEQKRANEIAQKTADNTEESIIKGAV